MELWKPIAAIVPAGLLLGLVGGNASRPEMTMREVRPWPVSVQENASEIEPWQPIYESGPQNLTPRAYSYRPDLDYEVFAWPDQGSAPAEPLAADYESEAVSPLQEGDMPLTRRATAELAAVHAQQVVAEAVSAQTPMTAMGGSDRETATIVLPPVPPRLDTTGFSADSAGPDVVVLAE